MTSHAIKEYIRYRWYAKNRHGVHSPFVYDFVERVVGNKDPVNIKEQLKEYKWLHGKYYNLLGRIVHHYGYKNLLCITTEQEDVSDAIVHDMLLLKETHPGEWIKLFNKYYPTLKNTGAVLVQGIHQTPRHTAKWLRLTRHPKVRLSIDLYGIGLLFFREDFKERQHFLIRY